MSRCICHGLPPHEPECQRNMEAFAALEREIAELKRIQAAYPTKADLTTEVLTLRRERTTIVNSLRNTGFRAPYDSEPLSAYVNSALHDARKG